MKVAAIILARMGSTRLRTKVLREIAGIPTIAHVIRRASIFPHVSERGVTLAIPDSSENDHLETIGLGYGVRVVRGDEDDVLDRFILAARKSVADIVYRITADNPLIDPGVVGATWDAFEEGSWDYAVMEDTPLGTTAEIVTLDALLRAKDLAVTERLKEHPTLALYENSDKFKMRLVAPPEKWKHPEWRFTVDTELDLQVVERIYQELGVDADLDTIAPFIKLHPEIALMNSSIEQQNWASLKERKNAIGKH
jgi:spore coat polysaccharide biosynthesis protein SpsF